MFRRLAGMLCCLVLGSPLAATAAPDCSLGHPARCATVNAVPQSELAAAVTRFVGSERVDYFRAGRPVAEQAMRGLGGPPDRTVQLPGDRFLFSACPPHDCGGNAVALIVAGDGRVLALGFSSFHCGRQCDIERRHLDFYVPQSGDAAQLVGWLTEWARGPRVASLVFRPSVDDGLEGRVAIHRVPG